LSARFRGIIRNFTLDHYINTHDSSHTELSELKDPVSETKKVSDFLAGVSDPKLDMTKAHVLGIDKLNERFDDCQKYVKSFHLNIRANNFNYRAISQVDVKLQPGNSKKK